MLKFDTDIDQKPILAVYLNKPLSEVVAEGQGEKRPEKKKSGDEEEGIEEETEKEGNPEENTTTLDLNDPLLKVNIVGIKELISFRKLRTLSILEIICILNQSRLKIFC